MTPFIPERFRERVVTHAVGVVAVERHPLILAIQGRPGDGKSFQLRNSLSEAQCTIFAVSASLLAGQYEGDAVQAIRSEYAKAGEYARINPSSIPVLIIEDFDLSPAGQRDGVRYTVNSQLLTGFLMHLADDVASCDVGTSERLPVFLTGNDFTTLPGPLTRPGRMEVFTWDPATDERVSIVHSMLREHWPSLTENEVARFVKENRKQPISMFAAALTDCLARHSYDIAIKGGLTGRDTLRQECAKGVVLTSDVYLAALSRRSERQSALRNFV